MKAAIRVVTALAVLAVCVALGVACSKHEAAPTGLRNFLVKASPYPPADSPAGALRLVQWCWRNRDVNQYATVLAADYCGKCSARDSIDNFAGECAFGRVDELESATRLFETGTGYDPPASSITFDYTSDLIATPDGRPGKNPGWHSQIRAQVLMRINTAESSTEIKGAVLFYLVRGDSASIPPDLAERGFGPDPNRWYIEDWEDGTFPEFAPAGARPTGPLPSRGFTWCALKARYR